MTSQEKALKELIEINFVKMMDGVPVRSSIDKAAVELLKNEEWGGNTALIVGYPKTGSHFLLSILHNLGFKRMYGQKDKNGNEVNSEPLEFQSKEAIHLMAQIAKENPSEKYVINHSHAFPMHLPAEKVPIIFISRDPRAVATSAYHFFGGLDKYKPFFDCYNIKNIDDFAKIMFQGKHSYGSITEYDNAWKRFANENSKARIHFVTFEELKTNSAVEIAKIAQFLGVENNAEEVAAKSDFGAKDVHFKSPTEAATAEHNQGGQDRHLIKRKGKIDSWKEELSEESLKYYRMYFE